MNSKPLALRVAGAVFGVVALLHLARILTGVPVSIGGWSLPMWINWMGLLATGLLCIWLWRLSTK